MNKTTVTKFFKSMQLTLSKHSPEILTGIGIAGMITTTVLAVKATPKALALIEEAEYEKDDICTPVEKVKVAWKPYIPAAVTGTVSIACLIGASSVNARRYTALTTAYKLSETALSDYREKVIETIGEKKEQVVRDAVIKEKMEKNPVKNTEVIVTKKGDTLFYDPLSARYFNSDPETIQKIENDLNRRMRSEMYISVNELYYEIGLPETALGNDVGWNIDRGYIEIEFSAQKADDGRPCLALSFTTPPRWNYKY